MLRAHAGPRTGRRAAPVAARRDPPDGTLFDPAEAAALRDHVGEDLALEPVPMTPRLMAHLEELGLIIRLRPGGHGLAAQPGETLGESIYESADRYGPHKLIAVTVNRAEFAAFGKSSSFFVMLAETSPPRRGDRPGGRQADPPASMSPNPATCPWT